MNDFLGVFLPLYFCNLKHMTQNSWKHMAKLVYMERKSLVGLASLSYSLKRGEWDCSSSLTQQTILHSASDYTNIKYYIKDCTQVFGADTIWSNGEMAWKRNTNASICLSNIPNKTLAIWWQIYSGLVFRKVLTICMQCQSFARLSWDWVPQ